jgi:hypothetical protein
MAIPVLSQINMGSQKIVSLLDPTSAQDAATKAYVDASYPTVVASVSSTGNQVTQTGNLLVSGGVPPAGVYRVTVYMNVTTAGSGNLDAKTAWNDGTAARIASNGTNGMPADISVSANNFAQGSTIVRSDGINNITWTITKS